MAEVCIGEPAKVCSRCGQEKLATIEFFSRKRAGWNTRCKVCVAEVGRLRWADPEYHAGQIAKRAVKYADPCFQEKERLRQLARSQSPKHIASEQARQKRRSADPLHQQKELERGRRRREADEHRAKVRAYGKKWYANNTSRRADASGAWYKANKQAVQAKRSEPSSRERTNKWMREHLRKHPHLKVLRSVGAAIAEILKDGHISGGFRYLPYSKRDLYAHLERQFLPGMTWDNYGSAWHVDHILPQSSFKVNANDPANCAEFQACWALPNLRPLFKRDNLVKSAKRTLLL